MDRLLHPPRQDAPPQKAPRAQGRSNAGLSHSQSSPQLAFPRTWAPSPAVPGPQLRGCGSVHMLLAPPSPSAAPSPTGAPPPGAPGLPPRPSTAAARTPDRLRAHVARGASPPASASSSDPSRPVEPVEPADPAGCGVFLTEAGLDFDSPAAPVAPAAPATPSHAVGAERGGDGYLACQPGHARHPSPPRSAPTAWDMRSREAAPAGLVVEARASTSPTSPTVIGRGGGEVVDPRGLRTWAPSHAMPASASQP